MSKHIHEPWYVKKSWIFILGVFTGGPYWIIGLILRNKWKSKSPNYTQSKTRDSNKTRIKELNSRKAYRKFNVSGITFENRQQLLDTVVRRHGLEGVDKIQFVSELDNEYNSDALKIIFEDIGHLGYVPKERAISIGKLLEQNTYDIKWDIKHFYNEDDKDISYMEIRLYQQK